MSAATTMITKLGEQNVARAALTYLAEPGDPALGALLDICEPGAPLASRCCSRTYAAGPPHPPADAAGIRVLRRDRLGGLIHDYMQVA